MATRLRHVALVNPPTPEFDVLDDDDEITFLPLEAVWPGARLDISRTRVKAEVVTGYTRFRAGDVLVPKITPTFEADRSAIVPPLPTAAGAGTTELHVVRPGPGIDVRYLNYLMSSAPFLQGGHAEMVGVAGQKRVPDSWLRDIPVPVTDRSEQCAIADFLDSEIARIDHLALNRSRISALIDARLATSVFGEVTGLTAAQSRPSGLDWVESLPAEWGTVRLRHVARIGSGHTPSRTVPEYWEACTIPWISLFDVGAMRSPFQESIEDTAQKISELGMANSSACLHPARTVVLSRTASVGFATIMARPMAVSQHFVTWTCGPELVPEYLLFTLRAMKQHWEALQVGTTNVTVFMPDLYSLRIPLPSVEEQRAIVARVRGKTERAGGTLERLNRQVVLLREHRQALITAAVTGELDVTRAA